MARLGHAGLAGVTRPFPVADPALLVDETVTCVVQVKGKVRGAAGGARRRSPRTTCESWRWPTPGVVAALDGAAIRKVIVRAPKLVNIVPM